jgi:dTDP-4-dehydrorhamnose reductase
VQPQPPDATLPEVWGGIECTRNRVGDAFFDQLSRSGHDRRASDLDRIAALGIHALRYPALWEHVAPRGLDTADWRRTDRRLTRLRALGVRPIVGLVHHGSGPAHTSLVDPSFGTGLAAYARAVAERYPWVDAYTPVNEPLTTARFSGLYGHWYPHGRDEPTFVRALIEQCRAIVLAMAEIRAVRPDAALVQTDDLGAAHGTAPLQSQVALENERRWLAWDLVAGRIDRDHPLEGWLRRAGATERELAWFLEHPTPADVVGVNHYLSSERFLDHRVDRYPYEPVGGNGERRYVDVLAARFIDRERVGPRGVLEAAWQRYGRPVAITEAHNSGHREEQVRWLDEVWRAACDARRDGADVRAVTVWSLLGAYGWDTLVTGATDTYEPGPFDLGGGEPRPTALAEAVRDLATRGAIAHPVAAAPGWWHRPEQRWWAADAGRGAGRSVTVVPAAPADTPPVLVLGAHGTLGRAVVAACAERAIACVGLGHEEVDAGDAVAVRRALRRHRPWAVINAAGYVRVDDAQDDVEACFAANAEAPAVAAAACAEAGVGYAWFSSDLVFAGRADAPYTEGARIGPRNTYGRSKAAGERAVAAAHPGALIVRTSAFFGHDDDANVVVRSLESLAAGHTVAVADDLVVSPTYVPDLVDALLNLVVDREGGIWHVANDGACTWDELVREAAQACGVSARRLAASPAREVGWHAPRPRYSALASRRGMILPTLGDALARFAQAWGSATAERAANA